MATFRCTSLRCTVTTISGEHATVHAQKHVRVRCRNSIDGLQDAVVVLSNDWVDTPLAAGDNIALVFDPPLQLETPPITVPVFTITSEDNLLVHHPNILLPVTQVLSAFPCIRKPVVASLVRTNSIVTPLIAQSFLYGQVLHQLLQHCLSASTNPPAQHLLDPWDERYMRRVLLDIVRSPKTMEETFRAQISPGRLLARVSLSVKGLSRFGKRHFPNIRINEPLSPPSTNHVTISGTRDIEESIWSTTYGLKGNIDASLQVDVANHTPSSSGDDTNHLCTKSVAMPLEIKSGHFGPQVAHRAQALLYAVLLADRYGTDIPEALLYYTGTDELIRIPPARNELRRLIIARNNLAYWISQRRLSSSQQAQAASLLPKGIDDERICANCSAADACMLYRKAEVRDDALNDSIRDLFNAKTGHLDSKHMAFFRKWELLLTAEEGHLQTDHLELSALPATARELRGHSLTGMKLASTGTTDATNSQFVHTASFTKATSSAPTITPGHISEGDLIILSIEPGALGYARGVVVRFTRHSVLLHVDRSLDNPNLSRLCHALQQPQSDLMFTIDKQDFWGVFQSLRHNLAQLFYSSASSVKWRPLLVDLAAPEFEREIPSTPLRIPEFLNPPQKTALRLAARAKDYLLLHGMPGTGKTTTIAALISMLVDAKKSVLLTSYTHAAVDNVLAKLEGVPFAILRLGNLHKIHPAARKHSLYQHAARMPTRIQFENIFLAPPVVATTCLSLDHPLFSRRQFDYCIVDEAAQMTLPAAIGPLRFAKVAILVGDHCQLPPLVQSSAARVGGMHVSLFERLLTAHPKAVARLTRQYRMNDALVHLSNRLTYNGRLVCASAAVEFKILKFAEASVNRYLSSVPPPTRQWTARLVDENCKIVFFNTDAGTGRESYAGGSLQNSTEAHLVVEAARALTSCGLPAAELGIICLYRQQVNLVSALTDHMRSVSVATVDSSQGQERECVILSTVRSTAQPASLLNEWTRINVALTRARTKLVIFGSRFALRSTDTFARFFAVLDENNWIYDLPSNVC